MDVNRLSQIADSVHTEIRSKRTEGPQEAEETEEISRLEPSGIPRAAL
jgi:hypothetical protein